MLEDPAFAAPLKWGDVVADEYDALLLVGGHAQGMKRFLESPVVHGIAAHFWDARRPVGAVCHGVLVLSRARSPSTGRALLAGTVTTTVPSFMESQAYLITRFLSRMGDYQVCAPPPLAVTRECGSCTTKSCIPP